MNYDHVPHVEFDGYRIYMADSKISTIKSKESWTASKVQRQFKIGYNAALLLIRYAQSLSVLSDGVTNGNGTKFEVLK